MTKKDTENTTYLRNDVEAKEQARITLQTFLRQVQALRKRPITTEQKGQLLAGQLPYVWSALMPFSVTAINLGEGLVFYKPAWKVTDEAIVWELDQLEAVAQNRVPFPNSLTVAR